MNSLTNPQPGLHLLIVDDDASAVRLLSRILHGVARITFASSGEEALDLASESSPDLILLDADMPGIGGFATCQALKAAPETADVPVIFVTSHTDTDAETQALTIGAVDFIHKPINPPVVLARVKTHLELKRRGDELRRLTVMDGLTNVANRRAFDDCLQKEWRRAMRARTPLSLLMLDVDYFKRYNDTYGHPAGDDCLRKVARVLADGARRSGDMVARYGGEEFAIILPHGQPANALLVAERLCAGVAQLGIPHAASLVASHVTVSIGVASLFVPCTDGASMAPPCPHCFSFGSCCAGPTALVTLADQALYTAKRNGRAQVACLVSTPDPALVELAND